MMTTRELPAIPTPVSEFDLYSALKKASPDLSKDALSVLIAHWALETGRGKKCIAYNIGNIKCPDEHKSNYCYFVTFERLSSREAADYVAKSTEENHAVITVSLPSGNCLVTFYPNHPACRFCAYETLDEGVADYLLHLKTRFAACWHFVEEGNVIQFCHSLKEQGYYTASEAVYTKAINQLFNSYRALFK